MILSKYAACHLMGGCENQISFFANFEWWLSSSMSCVIFKKELRMGQIKTLVNQGKILYTHEIFEKGVSLTWLL